ncbi:hypothetical protein LTR49_018025 [Elasticomyces elasticus]|nr:hypothetical protein LTR49_018025 [Elasticomyces elasticus]
MDHVPNGKGQPWRHVENLEGVVKDELFDAKAHVEEALRNEIDLDDELVKKLIRKVDYRLIPPPAFLYAIALVDRDNLPNARLAGLDEELDISKRKPIYSFGHDVLHSFSPISRCAKFSTFLCVGLFCSGASSLIGYGIQQMQEGLAGFMGWRWIFIIEALKPGLISRRPFLTKEEVSIVLVRIAQDRGDAIAEKLTVKRILHYLGDWKIWEFALLIWCATYRLRGPLIVFNCLIGIMGVCMLAFATAPTTRYIGVFFGVATTSANIPAIFSYQHNDVEDLRRYTTTPLPSVGQLKRAVSTAIFVGGGGCGGVIAANVFRQRDAPKYLPGLYTAIAVQALTVVLVSKNFYIFYRQSRKADRGETLIEGSEGFRYTY